METAKTFSADERKKLAKSGDAESNGSFPIVTAQDLHNAILAVGRAKNPSAARAHIVQRAKALGLTKTLPASWVKESAHTSALLPHAYKIDRESAVGRCTDCTLLAGAVVHRVPLLAGS